MGRFVPLSEIDADESRPRGRFVPIGEIEREERSGSMALEPGATEASLPEPKGKSPSGGFLKDLGGAISENLPRVISNITGAGGGVLPAISGAITRRLFGMNEPESPQGPQPAGGGFSELAGALINPGGARAPEPVVKRETPAPMVPWRKPEPRTPGAEIGPPREARTTPGQIAGAARNAAATVQSPVLAPIVRGAVGAADQLYGQGEGLAAAAADAVGARDASSYFAQGRVERDAAAGNVKPLTGLGGLAEEAITQIGANAPFYWAGMGPLKALTTPAQVAKTMESFAVTQAPTIAMAFGAAGASYNDPQRAQLAPFDRVVAAATDGFWEWMGEQLGFGQTIRAMKSSGLGGQATTERIRAMAGEALGESVTQVGQIENELRNGLRPGMTPAQVLQETAKAAAMGAIVSGSMQAGAAGRQALDDRMRFGSVGAQAIQQVRAKSAERQAQNEALLGQLRSLVNENEPQLSGQLTEPAQRAIETPRVGFEQPSVSDLPQAEVEPYAGGQPQHVTLPRPERGMIEVPGQEVSADPTDFSGQIAPAVLRTQAERSRLDAQRREVAEEPATPLRSSYEAAIERHGRESPEPQIRGVFDVADDLAIPPTATAEQVASYAQRAKPHHDQIVQRIARATGGGALHGPLKRPERIRPKIEADYGGDASQIKDAVRSTIVVNTPQQVSEVMAALEREARLGPKRRNLWQGNQSLGGYRDGLVSVLIGGMPTEVQVNLPEFIRAKEEAHPFKERVDSIQRKAQLEGRGLTPQETQQVQRYADAMEAIFSIADRDVQKRLAARGGWTPQSMDAVAQKFLQEGLRRAKIARALLEREGNASANVSRGTGVSPEGAKGTRPKGIGVSPSSRSAVSDSSMTTGMPSQSQVAPGESGLPIGEMLPGRPRRGNLEILGATEADRQGLEEHDADTSGGVNPLGAQLPLRGPRGTLDRLGRKLSATRGERAQLARPRNARQVLKAPDGKRVTVGAKTNADWLADVTARMTPAEIDQAKNWYREVYPTIVAEFGAEMAPQVTLAWLLSQQSASPSKGMQDVLRVWDRINGRPPRDRRNGQWVELKGGLADAKIEEALRGRAPAEGYDQKLIDFVDSAMGLTTRTVMGRDVRGGQPGVVDVWTARDLGFVDQTTVDRLGVELTVDARGAPSETQYEWGSERLNDIARWMTRRTGKPWTAAEVQAVGWMAMQRAYGATPQTVSDIFTSNTRRVSVGLEPGAGSAGRSMSAKEVLSIASEVAKQLGSMRINEVAETAGAYMRDKEGSVQIDVFASPETVDDFMRMLGYATRQTMVIGTRALPSGKQFYADVVAAEGLSTEAQAQEFYDRVLSKAEMALANARTKPQKKAAERVLGTVAGFQQVRHDDGSAGVRFISLFDTLTQDMQEMLGDVVASALSDMGVTAQFEARNAEVRSVENDWTGEAGKEGRAYLADLRERGRLQQAEWLQSHYGPDQGQGRKGRSAVRAAQETASGKVALGALDPAELPDKIAVPSWWKPGKATRLTGSRFIQDIGPDGREVLGQAISDLLGIGMPRGIIESVDAWGEYSTTEFAAKAAITPDEGRHVIAIAGAFTIAGQMGEERARSRGRMAGYIAHELTHHIDVMTEQQAISAESPRMTYSYTEENGYVAEGDLINELFAAMQSNQDIAAHFTYPLGMLDGRNQDLIKSEILAQMGSLYWASPNVMRRYMPMAYFMIGDMYESEEVTRAKTATQSLDAARLILSRALQVTGSGVGIQGRLFQRDIKRAGVEDRSGAAEREPGQGMGDRGPPSARDGGRGSDDNAGARRLDILGVNAPSGPPPSHPPARPWAWNPASQPFIASPPGTWDKLVRTFQDKLVDTKRVQEAISEMVGRPLPESMDVYLKDDNYYGRVSDATRKAWGDMFQPLLKEIQSSGIPMKDVEQFLYARHARERNAQMARINPGQGNAALSGMSDQQAGQILADARANGTIGALMGIARRIDAITAAGRRLIVQSGLETQAAISAWEATYKNYVPLYRDEDEPGVSAGFSVSGPESKRAMGSTRAAGHILANVFAQHERIIQRAERARVGRALYELAKHFPNPSFWKVDEPPKKRHIDPRTGFVVESVDPLYKQAENVIIVKDQGVEHSITFNKHNDRALMMAHGLKNLDAARLQWGMQHLARLTRVMANLATQWNPQFWVTNFTRDYQTMLGNIGSTELGNARARVTREVLPAMRGMYRSLRGKQGGRWTQLAEEFRNEGGMTGYAQMFDDIIDREKEIVREIKALSRSGLNPMRLGRAFFEWVGAVNNAIENAVRLAAYGAARDAGQSKGKSAALAKNLTVNFNRRGNASSIVNSLYMFFNANVQGNARLFQALLKSKVAQAAVGASVLIGFLLDIMNRTIADDDEDGNNQYDILPEYVKQRNWIIMLPDGDHVKVPLPYGYHVFPNAGRMVAAMLYDTRPQSSPMDYAWSFVQTMLDAFTPFGNTGSPLQAMAPSLLDPFVQWMENKSWTGAPIRREQSKFGKEVPEYQLTQKKDSEFAKAAARWLNEATGGDEIAPGAINLQPSWFDHVIRSAALGVGATAGQTADLGMKLALDEPISKNQIPFVNKFVGEIDDTIRAREFWDRYSKAKRLLDQADSYRKAGDLEKADEIVSENRSLIDLAQGYKRSRKELSGLNKERSAAEQQDEYLDRREALQDIERRRIEILRRVMRESR